MEAISIKPRKIVIEIIITIYGIKSKEIEKSLHISQALVSKHLNGERYYPQIDLFIIEKVFGIKIKDYDIGK